MKLSFQYDVKHRITTVITISKLKKKKTKTFSSIARVQIYEDSCRMLDITSDWQIRGLLPYDNIALIDRSFSFNDIRAFATAIEANLESLTLHSVSLTSRSVQVLCHGLNKCVHLNLLVGNK
jgi:hypothetical protein